MHRSESPGSPLLPFRFDRYIVVLSVIWTALVGLSLSWSLSEQREHLLQQAQAQARVNLDKDIVFRRWATGHGGVYVPTTDETPPNPFLDVFQAWTRPF